MDENFEKIATTQDGLEIYKNEFCKGRLVEKDNMLFLQEYTRESMEILQRIIKRKEVFLENRIIVSKERFKQIFLPENSNCDTLDDHIDQGRFKLLYFYESARLDERYFVIYDLRGQTILIAREQKDSFLNQGFYELAQWGQILKTRKPYRGEKESFKPLTEDFEFQDMLNNWYLIKGLDYGTWKLSYPPRAQEGFCNLPQFVKEIVFLKMKVNMSSPRRNKNLEEKIALRRRLAYRMTLAREYWMYNILGEFRYDAYELDVDMQSGPSIKWTIA